VLDDLGVIHRHVGGTLLEVLGDRVATRMHELRDEAVGLRDGRVRLIDEVPLRLFPALGVLAACVRLERPDVEALAAMRALDELGLRLSAVAALRDDALGPKWLCRSAVRRRRSIRTASTARATITIAMTTQTTMNLLLGGESR
jgi:type VI protein secretion system component VasF